MPNAPALTRRRMGEQAAVPLPVTVSPARAYGQLL
jgi:hypothetical protein